MPKSRQADIPATGDPEVPGLHLRRILGGHLDRIYRLAWSPEGRTLASGGNDSTVCLWDFATGRKVHAIAHEAPVWGLAWSPNGTLLAAGMDKGSIQISSAVTGRKLRVLSLPATDSTVFAVAWSPDGCSLVSGGSDGALRRWNAEHGRVIELLGSGGTIYDLCLSPDGKVLAGCGSSGTIRLWDVQDWRVCQELEGHTREVLRVAWSPRGQRLASASSDGTVRLWDPAAGTVSSILEAHTESISSVSFSADGSLLVSKSFDRTVRLWRMDNLATVAVLADAHEGWVGSSAAFHPSAPLLASLGADNLRNIRLWDLDLAVLLKRAPAEEPVSYATAKVVLVGESGVGKTALGWRLAHGKFRDHSSTHGQQFWALGVLNRQRADGTECEAILWDLAGQPDYRLIHALFLDEAALALVLFNPADRQEPLRGVDFWLKALGHLADRRIPTILVGTRTDRGDSTLTRAEIEAFCRDRGISGGYVATSARTGQGLDELIERMRGQVDWDRMAATVTTATFKRIKEYVLGLKQDPGGREVLTDVPGLRRILQAFAPGWDFSDAEMMTAVGHLAKHGYVKVLPTAAGEPGILLVPELLNNLAASFALEARRNPKGLGALDEQRVLSSTVGSEAWNSRDLKSRPH